MELLMPSTNLQVGDAAPDFNLRGAITKPEVKRFDIKLSDFRERQNVVLIFHPFAFTST